MHRDCKDKIREVAGEALQRLVKFLGPMYAAQGESLRSKAAAALGNLATDSDVNAQAIAQLGEPSLADCGPGLFEHVRYHVCKNKLTEVILRNAHLDVTSAQGLNSVCRSDAKVSSSGSETLSRESFCWSRYWKGLWHCPYNPKSRSPILPTCRRH